MLARPARARRRRRGGRRRWRDRRRGVDPQRLPGAPCRDGEVEALAQDFAAAYADEDAAALGRLLTRDAERVVPGARQRGRAAVLAAYQRQFADSETRSFELRDLAASGGATGRASARYVATYAGEPDVTGTITFGVLRDRGDAADRADLGPPGPAAS